MAVDIVRGGGGIFQQPSHTYVFFSLRFSASTEMELGEIKVVSLLGFCLDFFLWYLLTRPQYYYRYLRMLICIYIRPLF